MSRVLLVPCFSVSRHTSNSFPCPATPLPVYMRLARSGNLDAQSLSVYRLRFHCHCISQFEFVKVLMKQNFLLTYLKELSKL